MYATPPFAVLHHPSPGISYSPGDRAELIARLESERIPNGLAFVSDPTADDPAFDDSLAAVVARRRELVAAIEPSPAGWDRQTAPLRVVA